MPITEKRLERSPSPQAALDRLLDEVGNWIDAHIGSFHAEAPTNGQGQLTYTCSWEPYLRVRPSAQAVEFLEQKRDEVREYFVALDEWRHGYWRQANVRNGMEHFTQFLPFLARLNPQDEKTKNQILDAAEHLGNWDSNSAPWFEPANGLFRSLLFGIDGADERSTGWNMPEHFHCVNLAIAAYDCCGDDRYLDLATSYSARWADAILATDSIPAGLTVSGPVFNIGRKHEQLYRECIPAAGSLGSDPDRAENLLANGAIHVFLRHWQETRDDRFRSAAELILNELLPQLADPDAGALADAIRAYRRTTNDKRYDDLVLAAIATLTPYDIHTIGVQPNVMRLTRTSGVGKRVDMPVWFEDLHLRRHNPILLSLAAEIKQDPALAALSLDLARTYFVLARETLRVGRQNSDAGNTIGAVARGHSRENGSGVLLGVLGAQLDTPLITEDATEKTPTAWA